MTPRINVTLTRDERSALMRLAEFERRDPRKQAALIIRRELEREGFLQPLVPPFSKVEEIGEAMKRGYEPDDSDEVE